MKENYLSGKPQPRELQWFEVTYIRNAGTRQAKSEAPRPSRQDGTGTPGPFDRTHGPEYIEWASREGNIV